MTDAEVDVRLNAWLRSHPVYKAYVHWLGGAHNALLRAVFRAGTEAR